MADATATPRRKLAAVLLVVAAAAFPVLLYDRLVTRHLAEQRGRPVGVRQIVEAYHEVFYTSKETWKLTWLGVPTVQNPNDVWITQELISRLKPDYIVETGTLHGGGAAIWAMVQDQVNPRGRVITIDIVDLVDRATMPPILRDKVDFLLGSSTDPAIVASVTRRVAGGKVMVILDSDHRKSHVLAELRAYAPLVGLGGYLIVQDTDVNGHPVAPAHGPGPLEAVQEFLAGDSRFESDLTQERLLFTMHPRGYLKRVR